MSCGTDLGTKGQEFAGDRVLGGVDVCKLSIKQLEKQHETRSCQLPKQLYLPQKKSIYDATGKG